MTIWAHPNVLKKDEFIEEVFEIAFGDNAINKDYSYNEVIDQLLEFSDHALKYEEQEELL